MAEHRVDAGPEAFIAALKKRDERAFTALVLRYQDRVFNLTRRLLGRHEEARDVTQEVFVAVFEKIDSYRGESSLTTWIYRIAANQAKNRIKYLAHRQDGRRENLDDMVRPPSVNPLSTAIPRPDEAFARDRVARLVDRALGELDEEQRIVLVLRDIEGQSYEDIAAITGLNLGTVKSRLHRGRLRMKELLAVHVDPREFSDSSGGES